MPSSKYGPIFPDLKNVPRISKPLLESIVSNANAKVSSKFGAEFLSQLEKLDINSVDEDFYAL